MKFRFVSIVSMLAFFNPLIVQAEDSEKIRSYVQEMKNQCHGSLMSICSMTSGVSMPKYCQGNSIDYNVLYNHLVNLHNKKDTNKRSFYAVKSEINDLCGIEIIK